MAKYHLAGVNISGQTAKLKYMCEKHWKTYTFKYVGTQSRFKVSCGSVG